MEPAIEGLMTALENLMLVLYVCRHHVSRYTFKEQGCTGYQSGTFIYRNKTLKQNSEEIYIENAEANLHIDSSEVKKHQ